MSEDKYRARAPDDRRPGEHVVPLVEHPGLLYPPGQERPHSYHEHNNGDRRHSGSHSLQGIPPPPATVVVTQPGAAVSGGVARYRWSPVLIVCQYCSATVTTTVEDVRGLLQYVLVILACLFGCWLGCCLIPLFLTDLRDVKHSCPNCGRLVGRYAHLG